MVAGKGDDQSEFSFHMQREEDRAENSESESLFSFHVSKTVVKKIKTPLQPPGSRMMGPPVEYAESDSEVDSTRFAGDTERPAFLLSPHAVITSFGHSQHRRSELPRIIERRNSSDSLHAARDLGRVNGSRGAADAVDWNEPSGQRRRASASLYGATG